MKLIRKLYWIAVAVMMVKGFPYDGIEDFMVTLALFAFFGVLLFRILPRLFRSSSCRSAGRGLRGNVIGGLEQGTSNAVSRFMMGGGSQPAARTANNDAWLRKQEADRRVWERTKALNEAKFHEYYAKKNAGTYDGYRSGNRAQAARNRANHY